MVAGDGQPPDAAHGGQRKGVSAGSGEMRMVAVSFRIRPMSTARWLLSVHWLLVAGLVGLTYWVTMWDHRSALWWMGSSLIAQWAFTGLYFSSFWFPMYL